MSEIRDLANGITNGQAVTAQAVRAIVKKLGGSLDRFDELNTGARGGVDAAGYLMLLIAARLEDYDMLE